MKKKRIPGSVVRRLTRYLAHARKLKSAGVEWISSANLASMLGLTSSTVRQDISHMDYSGTAKRGYNVVALESCLGSLLGADIVWKMVVVGAGNLGRALALHEEFPRNRFRIEALFDRDQRKVGRKIGDARVLSMDRLPDFVRANRIDIGVIAVPSVAAQNVADLLIMTGVKGLLNMTLTHVIASKKVPVVDVRIVASLQELAHAMKARRSR